jgi:hypothetical protein
MDTNTVTAHAPASKAALHAAADARAALATRAKGSVTEAERAAVDAAFWAAMKAAADADDALDA